MEHCTPFVSSVLSQDSLVDVQNNVQLKTQRVIKRGGVTYDDNKLHTHLDKFLKEIQYSKISSPRPANGISNQFTYNGEAFTIRDALGFGACAIHAAVGLPDEVSGVYQYPSSYPKDGSESGIITQKESLYLAKVFLFMKLRKEFYIEDGILHFSDSTLEDIYLNCIMDTFKESNDDTSKSNDDTSNSGSLSVIYTSEEGKKLFAEWKNSIDSCLSHEVKKNFYLRQSIFDNYEMGCCENFTYFLSDNEVELVAHIYGIRIQILGKNQSTEKIEPLSIVYNAEQEEARTVYIYYDNKSKHFSACERIHAVKSSFPVASPNTVDVTPPGEKLCAPSLLAPNGGQLPSIPSSEEGRKTHTRLHSLRCHSFIGYLLAIIIEFFLFLFSH